MNRNNASVNIKYLIDNGYKLDNEVDQYFKTNIKDYLCKGITRYMINTYSPDEFIEKVKYVEALDIEQIRLEDEMFYQSNSI